MSGHECCRLRCLAASACARVVWLRRSGYAGYRSRLRGDLGRCCRCTCALRLLVLLCWLMRRWLLLRLRLLLLLRLLASADLQHS